MRGDVGKASDACLDLPLRKGARSRTSFGITIPPPPLPSMAGLPRAVAVAVGRGGVGQKVYTACRERRFHRATPTLA